MRTYTVGCLDCKVDNGYIELIDQYKARGWEIINSAHLDKAKGQYDILVTTWTQLNQKRLEAVQCRAIVIRDNDEPDNVLDVNVVNKMGIPFYLIDNWGISTRVAWNENMIIRYAVTAPPGQIYDAFSKLTITIIANTPSHDAMAAQWRQLGATVHYPNLPKTVNLNNLLENIKVSNVVIVHLGKKDFAKFWLDSIFNSVAVDTLFISTTRGPLYSAYEMNYQIAKWRMTAVLDWAWEEEKLLAHSNLHLTHHQSYKSELARVELTAVTTKAIEHALAELAKADKGLSQGNQ